MRRHPLFATAAKDAGPDLNRRTFVEAMSKITDFPGTMSPVWSFGPDKFYGPVEYQVVKVHTNEPPSSQCKVPKSGKLVQTCWVTVAAVQAAAGLLGPDRPAPAAVVRRWRSGWAARPWRMSSKRV